ncbi:MULTISPECIES: dihydroorotase [unclassified Actinomyces]|uniref:dihydroorotase n=1 Tax=unclassified Actinomyces TaxID=2609248 RepID=UPI0008A64234|nr:MULTISPECIES: dihydroorotase [unclassified Actinomyces]MBS6101937.1 dihydroorotase [Actinomyces sp.]MDU4286621.1 dihydroorotase [Actinomyces sp.]MDU7238243.1 dihydroorotase [Actinomyces sp.]OFR32253.1 dihydroorotase [Actinomyces sp. HMSC065F11]
MSKEILFVGARPYGEESADIAVRGNRIVAVGKEARSAVPEAEVVDVTGLVALPGLVDLHTHLREPGQEDAETVFTGTRAAAVGGYTCVFAMANTNPVADTASVVEQVKMLGDKAGWVEVHPIGAVTVGLEGKTLSSMSAMAKSEAAVRVFSDDGKCVADPVLMRRALEYVKTFGGVIAQHAQDPALTEGAQMNESPLSAELGLAGWPAVAEEAIIARDVALTDHVGSRYHVLHASTKGSVEQIREAKRRGINVTAEATPHHIFLTEEEARSYDPRFKVNPPLRTQEDVEALRDALEDGTIDTIGTDHAPHPLEMKDCEWQAGAFGMIGIETALPVLITTMVDTGRMNWRDIARVMSEKPAQIGLATEQGQPIEAGSFANLAFVDPSVERVVENGWSRSTNNPYLGHTLKGQVKYTVYRGKITVREGMPVEEER